MIPGTEQGICRVQLWHATFNAAYLVPSNRFQPEFGQCRPTSYMALYRDVLFRIEMYSPLIDGWLLRQLSHRIGCVKNLC
jgi:hypothetical protein